MPGPDTKRRTDSEAGPVAPAGAEWVVCLQRPRDRPQVRPPIPYPPLRGPVGPAGLPGRGLGSSGKKGEIPDPFQ